MVGGLRPGFVAGALPVGRFVSPAKGFMVFLEGLVLAKLQPLTSAGSRITKTSVG